MLPVPAHYNPANAEKVYRVDYAKLSQAAIAWRKQHGIKPAASDTTRICLLPIDCQNTFCLPEFELFVGGRSGRGAIDDDQRICAFIYRELDKITEIAPTMDTHTAMQLFHPLFWVDANGQHPAPMTMIEEADIRSRKWRVNPAVAHSVAGGNFIGLEQHALHYTHQLAGRYPLFIWPYHAMLGGIGHALVSVIEEALFFHNITRHSQTGFEIKGGNPLTENYSVLRPEVLTGANGQPIAQKNARFYKKLIGHDAVIIAGQAASHCVAWSIDDLLSEILATDPALAGKVYIMTDCTSPVVVPGIVDFTDQANAAFDRFAKAGMHIVQSTTPLADWPGIKL